MKLFKCQNCGQIVYFENTKCEACGFTLGFQPSAMSIVAMNPDKPARLCDNAQHAACNWLVETDEPLCLACRHNHVIPDLTEGDDRP